jgi:hypothetical protein
MYTGQKGRQSGKLTTGDVAGNRNRKAAAPDQNKLKGGGGEREETDTLLE